MRQQTPTSVTRQLMELQNMGVPALQTRFEELYGFPTTQKQGPGRAKSMKLPSWTMAALNMKEEFSDRFQE